MPPNPIPENHSNGLADRAVALAAVILHRSKERQTTTERHQREQMRRMIEDPKGKVFTIAMADNILRMRSSRRAARALRDLLRRLGLPAYLTSWERSLLQTGAQGSRVFPWLVMPLITRHVREESSHVILSARERELNRYLDQRRESGIRVNINLLGEAVLGETEARKRLDATLKKLADPRIDYVSVKISSIFSQIHLPAYDSSLRVLQGRLRRLYRVAIEHGATTPKVVNLDMEEYDDLHLTIDVFRSVLDEPEFEKLEAGVVLQAYLPDAFKVQQELTEWARARHARTNAGIKIRLVKGANLAMEQVEASLRGWPQAPYDDKPRVDANFKRMLHFGCRPENAAAVRLGVASHNLFDLAYALLLREEQGIADRVEFEMLEGMANAQARSVQEHADGLLVYAPVVRPEHFESAVAYLVRRLDENTAPQNFLHDLFGLEEGSPAWIRQRDRFLEACETAQSPALPSAPNRTQNRLTESFTPDPADAPFQNEADTDFSLPSNRRWAREIVQDASSRTRQEISPVDDENAVDQALARAVEARQAWEARGIEGRAEVLRRAAAVMGGHRAAIVAGMMREANRAMTEADSEVSEAIDFANYYSRAFDGPGWLDGSRPRALGVVLVTPPWNFPYAIPAGGCLAALMAGNAVILKPAPETPRSAQLLAEHLWEAGVPKDVLQFLPVPDSDVGRKLVTDDRVAAVILTGGMETARLFRQWKPNLRLFAETSGKNCLIVTAAADLDLAIKDLVKSAFSHAGQKCSATSLALVEAGVYDDPAFLRQLKDAAESLPAGPATDPVSIVTPLIRKPGKELHRALTTLDPGESWLVAPKKLDEDGKLWTPGIKLGVRSGSWFHRTECFGPVLGLIRVEDLEQAIAVQNDSAYGLAGGIHSLDTAEIARWREAVQVGNAYVNRGTTGAIVRRQPFGGWKDSSVGPSAKAGGPNYVANFCHWEENTLPKHVIGRMANAPDVSRLAKSPEVGRALEISARSYAYWWQREFSRARDPGNVLGESNQFRYRSHSAVVIRVQSSTNPLPLLQAIMACRIVDAKFEVSAARAIGETPEGHVTVVEDDDAFALRVARGKWSLVRLLTGASPRLRKAVNETNTSLIDAPVMANGRLELRHYLREQSLSETTHRYGNLPPPGS
ncbi:MAG: bifunctional proline dehydrogenase/L-glutamate gamma-semialdehyde dehydrogenase [Verrucomicrobiales bacterium]